jgi:hypothetical protein
MSRTVMWALAGTAALGLASCERWECDFDSHGACVEFETDPPDMGGAKARVDALLARELPFWGLANLNDWRIQLRVGAEYTCYLAQRNDGCTDYLEKTLSVRVPPDAPECFEAAELLHELGHYALGDPMHSAARWQDVDPAFAPFVWDHPGAPAACVNRYEGIRSGVWAVREDRF